MDSPLDLGPSCRGGTPDGPCDDEECEGHVRRDAMDEADRRIAELEDEIAVLKGERSMFDSKPGRRLREVAEAFGWRDHLNAVRRLLVGTPPNVDSVDAAIGYALNDCEAAINAALDQS